MRSARLQQMHRGALHDVYRARSACLRGMHSRLFSPGDQLGRSKPVQGWGISAELSHGLGSEHYKSSAGAVCTERQTRHDACRSRHGYLRRNHSRLFSPGDPLGRSKPVQGWGIPEGCVLEHRQLFSAMPAPRTLKRTQFSARSDQYGC